MLAHGSLDHPVRADHGEVTRGGALVADVVRDGLVGVAGAGDEDGEHKAVIPLATETLGGLVEENRDSGSFLTAEGNQALYQCLLILQVTQGEARHMRDEVVTIDDVLHAGIVNHIPMCTGSNPNQDEFLCAASRGCDKIGKAA